MKENGVPSFFSHPTARSIIRYPGVRLQRFLSLSKHQVALLGKSLSRALVYGLHPDKPTGRERRMENKARPKSPAIEKPQATATGVQLRLNGGFKHLKGVNLSCYSSGSSNWLKITNPSEEVSVFVSVEVNGMEVFNGIIWESDYKEVYLRSDTQFPVTVNVKKI